MAHPFQQYAEWLDRELIQKVINNMKTSDRFKQSLAEFNDRYPVKNSNRFPSNMGKQTADWVDIDIIQDCVDRMNPHLSNEEQSERYKKELEEFTNGTY
jgi:hypothetical protein